MYGIYETTFKKYIFFAILWPEWLMIKSNFGPMRTLQSDSFPVRVQTSLQKAAQGVLR